MLLASAFRHTDTIVALVGADSGAFIDVNPAFERRLDRAREDVIGRRPVDIGLWPDRQTRAAIWSRLRVNETVHALPVKFAGSDGIARPGRLSCEYLELDGQRGILCLLEDLGPCAGAETQRTPVARESYRALFLAAAEGIYRSLPADGFIDANPAMARLFGYDSVDALLALDEARMAALYLVPGRREQLRALVEAEGSFANQRSEIVRADGRRAWISENCRAIRDPAGRVAFYEGSAVDITDALAAEAALRQSEALYKIVVDNCRDGVYLIQRGVLRFCNQAMADILGTTRAALIGCEYMTLIHPDDLAAQAARRAAREAGSTEPQRYEVRVRHADGHYVGVAVNADAVFYEGDIASTGVMRDVTAERAQREALEAAERRYRLLFEGSPIGLFKTHVDGRVLEANPALLRMMGFDSTEEITRAGVRMHDIYLDPEERRQVLAELTRAGHVHDREVMMRRRDGSTMLGSVSARISIDGAGQPSEITGSVVDMSARRAMEQALARSEARYRTLVEQSQVGVFLYDGERFVYANHALESMFGYPPGRLSSIEMRRLVAPEHIGEAEERGRRLRAGESIPPEFDIGYLRADGGRFWARVSARPIDVDGVPHLTGMVLDITRHREAERRLRFHATHDALTGLPNRLMFQEALERAIDQARREQRHEYAVLFLDLDGFKLVNDSLGHAAGDLLLVTLAEKISTALAGEAMVARYGGDEFTILPTGPCDRARASTMAREVIALFDAPFDIGEQSAWSSASIGIVLGRAEYRTPTQILRDADTAMYRAKAAGKSGYVVFDETMHGAARARFQLETDLRAAHRGGQFEVHYQPLVRLADGAILGCEALVRWRHPQRGLLAPAEFLQVAEEIGLIAQIDGWVLETACAQVVDWQQRFPAFADLRLNVNLDDRQMGSPALIEEVGAVIARCGIAPALLSLEVTETIFRSDRQQAERTLHALKSLGVTLVVDDFGTGYSSLDSFAAAPFDALKVDRSFVQDMESNPRHRAIVRTIVAFASDLGLALTAEGVENPGQSALLQGLGCLTGQGYLFAPPLAAGAFAALLAEGRPLTG